MLEFNAKDISWDDVKLFLICAKLESFRAAANHLKVTSSTIVRRIDRFETCLGARLFDRLPSGVRLTPEGNQLMASAKKLQEGAYELQRSVETFEPARRGVVKISIMEGLGSYWLMPRLIEFQQANPMLVIDLRCSNECANVLEMQADVAVQFTRPEEHPDLICAKIGRLHIYPFASPDYVKIYGAPNTPHEVLNHRLVDQVSEQLDEGAIPRYLGVSDIEGIVSVRTNSSAAHYYAVEKGAGIGGMPTYARCLGANVVPVDCGVKHHMDIWMTYHPMARKTPRIATVIDWVRGSFDSQRFPWFADSFIHPDDLKNEEFQPRPPSSSTEAKG